MIKNIFCADKLKKSGHLGKSIARDAITCCFYIRCYVLRIEVFHVTSIYSSFGHVN